MAKRSVKPDETKPPVNGDEQYFADMQALSERSKAILEAAADEMARAAPGVPREVCKQLITKGSACLCLVVGKIIEDKEKAAALKRQQEQEANAA